MMKGPTHADKLTRKGYQLLKTIMEVNFPTIACLNGHAFGAGFFWALACDFRLMRTKRGFLNLPELTIGLPLSSGFAASVRCKVPKETQVKAVMCAHRFTAEQAVEAKLVNKAVPVENL